MSTTVKQPQRVFVYNHMKTHGYITDVVARNYGVRRLASRIDELRNNAVHVITEMRRDDMGTAYAYYTLGPSMLAPSVRDRRAAAVPTRS